MITSRTGVRTTDTLRGGYLQNPRGVAEGLIQGRKNIEAALKESWDKVEVDHERALGVREDTLRDQIVTAERNLEKSTEKKHKKKVRRKITSLRKALEAIQTQQKEQLVQEKERIEPRIEALETNYSVGHKCPITTCVMSEPVTDCFGDTYDKQALLDYRKDTTISPVQEKRWNNKKVTPNFVIKEQIDCQRDENTSKKTKLEEEKNSVETALQKSTDQIRIDNGQNSKLQ